jgi:hypothetical protein
MPAYQEIPVNQLSGLIGTPQCSAIVDDRIPDGVQASPWMIPGSVFVQHSEIESLAAKLLGRSAVVVWIPPALNLRPNLLACWLRRAVSRGCSKATCRSLRPA